MLKIRAGGRTIDRIASGIDIEELRGEIETMLTGAAAGEPLGPRRTALVDFAINATPTVLDGDGISAAATAALEAGVSPEELEEALVFVSGIGLHSLIEGTRRLGAVFTERGEEVMTDPLDERRRALLDRYVDADMAPFEEAVPDFFEALVRLSPAAFEGFFAYRSLPWREPLLDPLDKELMAIAVDALPSHRFLPTLRLHVRKALDLGAGTEAIGTTLDLAAASPEHPGVA